MTAVLSRRLGGSVAVSPRRGDTGLSGVLSRPLHNVETFDGTRCHGNAARRRIIEADADTVRAHMPQFAGVQLWIAFELQVELEWQPRRWFKLQECPGNRDVPDHTEQRSTSIDQNRALRRRRAPPELAATGWIVHRNTRQWNAAAEVQATGTIPAADAAIALNFWWGGMPVEAGLALGVMPRRAMIAERCVSRSYVNKANNL